MPCCLPALSAIPQGVIDRIVTIQRRFLWSGSGEKKSLALAKWEIVQLPRDKGGLNISNLLYRNLGLLFKWVWRFFSEPDSLWKQIIQAKYKYSSTVSMKELSIPKQGGPWRDICKSLLKRSDVEKIIQSASRKRVGDGKETSFWHDSWVHEEALKTIYPRLFRKTDQPDATVASMRKWKDNEWKWEIPWSGPLRVRDQMEWNSLMGSLSKVNIEEGQKDQLSWPLDKSGTYSVKSFYLELSSKAQPLLCDVSRKMWKGLVPFRIEVFQWLVLLGKINTKAKLASLNIIPPSDILCPMCSVEKEEISHLFLHCTYAQSLWGWWCELWSLSWVWPSTLEAAFEQWYFPCKNKFFNKVWLAIFQVIIWSIWKERNARTFNNQCSSTQETQNMVLLRLCWWLKSWKEPFPYSPNEVLRNPPCLRWKHSVATKPKKGPYLDQQCQSRITWVVEVSKIAASNCLIIGGSLHDNKGTPLCAFSRPIPLMDVDSAATLAVHRALQLVLNNNQFRKSQVEIEAQYQQAVQWCSNKTGGPTNLQFILTFIRMIGSRGIKSSIKFKNPPSFPANTIIVNMGLSRFSDSVVWVTR